MIVLPWPPKELSPNNKPASKAGRMAKHRVEQNYRQACFWLTKEAQETISGVRVHLTITFVPPDRRARDLDNMLASIKSGLDGVADALGVNDKIFRPVTIDVTEEIGGMVRIEFSNA
jgi:crossover junction endodeoxyribonuclease RusA